MKELAEAIHNATCGYNHTDQCDYFYGSWDNPTYAHEKALHQADTLVDITGLGPAECARVVTALAQVRRMSL